MKNKYCPEIYLQLRYLKTVNLNDEISKDFIKLFHQSLIFTDSRIPHFTPFVNAYVMPFLFAHKEHSYASIFSLEVERTTELNRWRLMLLNFFSSYVERKKKHRFLVFLQVERQWKLREHGYETSYITITL